MVGELISKLNSGHCGQLPYTTDTIKMVLGALLYYEELRELGPAIVYRLHRCFPEDVNAFYHMVNRVFGPGGLWETGSPNTSTMLSNHVILSEIWDNDNPPSYEQMKSIADNSYICQGNGPKFAKIYDMWPRYPRDPFDDSFADYTGPLLMLHGNLDPTAPIEKAVVMQNTFTHTSQRFVLFPYGQHRLTLNTTISNSGSDCASEIMFQFLSNPEQVPDISCIHAIEPLDFTGTSDWIRYYLGKDDLWEN
jgi:hypothetical protein